VAWTDHSGSSPSNQTDTASQAATTQERGNVPVRQISSRCIASATLSMSGRQSKSLRYAASSGGSGQCSQRRASWPLLYASAAPTTSGWHSPASGWALRGNGSDQPDEKAHQGNKQQLPTAHHSLPKTRKAFVLWPYFE
jgi:hypothetical protein